MEVDDGGENRGDADGVGKDGNDEEDDIKDEDKLRVVSGLNGVFFEEFTEESEGIEKYDGNDEGSEPKTVLPESGGVSNAHA